MQFRIRSTDPILEAALIKLQDHYEERDRRKYTLSQAVQQYLREQLVLNESMYSVGLADKVGDLTATIAEHLAAENVLVYTLVNGVPPEEGKGSK
jgi:hypothetical protein